MTIKEKIYLPLQKNQELQNTIIPLTDANLTTAALAVAEDPTYSKEEQLLQMALYQYPTNTDRIITAMKIGLIDITNSTHISQHKSRVNVVELLDVIMGIDDLDSRIETGDASVVSEIAEKTKSLHNNAGANFFSFASKFCCYHNIFVYEKDDYSIYDSKLRDHLRDYDSNLKPAKILNWVNSFDYPAYNAAIGNLLSRANISVDFKRRKFDNLVWYNNR